MHFGIHTLRAHALALLAALGVALIGLPSLAEDARPRLTGVVNVNTATADELQILPGIGESRAQALIAMRKQRGGFKSVDELLEIKGIGESSLGRLRPFVVVSGKTTAHIE